MPKWLDVYSFELKFFAEIYSSSFIVSAYIDDNSLIPAKWIDSKPLVYVSFSSLAVSDIFVTATLCVYLFRARTGVKRSAKIRRPYLWSGTLILLARTDSLLTVIMIYVINTGLLSSLSLVSDLITVQAFALSKVLFWQKPSLRRCLWTSYIWRYSWSLRNVRLDLLVMSNCCLKRWAFSV